MVLGLQVLTHPHVTLMYPDVLMYLYLTSTYLTAQAKQCLQRTVLNVNAPLVKSAAGSCPSRPRQAIFRNTLVGQPFIFGRMVNTPGPQNRFLGPN